jgi:hypothetical protein
MPRILGVRSIRRSGDDRSRPVAPLWRTLAAAFLYLLTAQAGAAAQARRWIVEPRASLAWWQVAPHLSHLWASTCPEEPSWRPGEGRSAGWTLSGGLVRPRDGNDLDTVNVPLYPRWAARALCTAAVQGYVTVADTVRWRGVRGEVTVRADALVTGGDERDAFTRQAILETNRYPDIRFTIDSVVNVTRVADTLHGTAMGVFTLRNVAKRVTAPVLAWPEGGGLRVLAKFRIEADSLVPVYGLSKYALGLGVGVKIWQVLFSGVDLLLRPE